MPGDEIAGLVITRNVGDRSLEYVSALPDNDFKVLVLSPNGSSIASIAETKLTNEFARRLQGIIQKVVRLEFAAGTQRVRGLPLNKLYEFTQPGLYSVSVSHPVPKLDGSGDNIVSSGTALIRIIEPSNAAAIENSNTRRPTSPAPLTSTQNVAD